MSFEDSLDGFLRHMKMSRTGSADTQNAYHRDILRFLQFLEEEGIESFEDFGRFDLIILENVGNLVCPAEFDTGAVKNMCILSVPEGDDKPLKYPLMFEVSNFVLINKTDVIEYFDFDMDACKKNIAYRNPKADIFEICAKDGRGIKEVAEYIKKQMEDWRN